MEKINSILKQRIDNMNDSIAHYQVLATLFLYPGKINSQDILAVDKILKKNYPQAAAELQAFTDFVSVAPKKSWEEIFTRSFEVQAITTLDLGYIIFGDDYKRGSLLVSLTKEYKAAGIDCGTELPDHLPNILKLLPHIKDADALQDLVTMIIFPALTAIIAEFDPGKIDKNNRAYKKYYKTLIERSADCATIYELPLKALSLVLQKDFNLDDQAKADAFQTIDFLQSITAEIRTEKKY